MNDNIIGITLGIRFSRSFRLLDITGNIVDNILYSELSPFGKEFFPKIQELPSREKTLYNPSTTNYLRINSDDIILGISINQDFESKYDWIKTSILKYYKEVLFKNYQIINIHRIGIIFTYKIPKSKVPTSSIALLTNNSIKDAENINISFSRKIASSTALIRKNVQDYMNTIYTYEELVESMVASLDYQYYYDPIIEDLRDCAPEKVLCDAGEFLKSNYYPLLEKHAKDK
jgi:hypothetical protein